MKGHPVRVIVRGANAFDTVRVGGSIVGNGGGPCPPAFSQCLDLEAPVVLGSGVADSAGTAEIVLNVPAGLSANQAWLQAGAGSSLSPSVSMQLLPDTAWSPPPGTSWQWQLQGNLDRSYDVEMYDIDLFDTSPSTIQQLHNEGRVVICYFSAGSREDWRSDAGDFPSSAIGNPLGGWPGERWVDTRNSTVRNIMRARMDLAASKGCDGVEPDNVDGYTNNPGFSLTSTTQLDYNRFLAEEAHARGLSIGLKNDVDQVRALEPWFDWALNEECLSYNECYQNQPFIDAGKAVFHVEYADAVFWMSTVANQRCGNAPDHDTLIKTWDLDHDRIDCATW